MSTILNANSDEKKGRKMSESPHDKATHRVTLWKGDSDVASTGMGEE